MHRNQSGLRKAAILVAALDRATADALLERMTPEQNEQVRHAVLELGPIDPEEERRVIEEFVRVGPMVPRQDPSGVELDGRLARRLAERSFASAEMPQADAAPFHFLQQAQCEEIAGLLAIERSQTIALVLAHLSPEQAGGVLVHLPAATQAEVVRRLVDLEETDAEVLREVERGLQSRLAQRVPLRRRRVAGASAVSGILRASDQAVGRRILENLSRHDRRLAEQFTPVTPAVPEIDPVAFEDLIELDAISLALVVESVEPELLSLALIGASPAVVDCLLQPLPRHRAGAIRRELEDPMPTRLSDVDAARTRLAETARGLAKTGRIRLPSAQASALRMTA